MIWYKKSLLQYGIKSHWTLGLLCDKKGILTLPALRIFCMFAELRYLKIQGCRVRLSLQRHYSRPVVLQAVFRCECLKILMLTKKRIQLYIS